MRSSDIRQQNEKLVLNLFYDYEKLSQSGVVVETGLKACTVMRIFSKLEGLGDIIPCDDNIHSNAKPGRRPLYYTVNPHAHYVIGVCACAESIAVHVFDFTIKCCYEDSCDLPAGCGSEEFCARTLDLVRKFFTKFGVCHKKVLGISVGISGGVYSESCESFLRHKLGEELGLPVFTGSSTAVFARNEFRYGKGRQCDASILLLYLGDVVEASFIHQSVNFALPFVMDVGNVRMNTEFEGRSISYQLNDVLSKQKIYDEFTQMGSVKSRDDIHDALEHNNPQLIGILSEKKRYLINNIKDLQVLFKPKIFILATDEFKIAEIFACSVQSEYINNASQSPDPIPDIIPIKFNPYAVCRGAADTVYDCFFHVGRQWKTPQVFPK
jgi:predicted NBD/HSP70 family sugar kinase